MLAAGTYSGNGFRMRVRLLFGLAVLLVASGCNQGALVLEQRVKGISTNKLVSVEILPDQLATNGFRKVISNMDDLVRVSNAFASADRTPLGGHNGPIYECTLVLKFDGGKESRFLASVHKRQPNDLHVTDTFWELNRNGCYDRGRVRRVRIPGLGNWIAEQEPRGKLSSAINTDR